MANRNPKNKFRPGNKLAKKNKGRKHKSTIIKELLGIDVVTIKSIREGKIQITDLKELVLKNHIEALTSKSIKRKDTATQKISDYLFPKMRILDLTDNIPKRLIIIKTEKEIIQHAATKSGDKNRS